MANNGQRMDQWLIGVTIDGVPQGIWDKFSGGDVSATDTKYRQGGMVPEVSLGGPTTIADITVSRLYIKERDHAFAKRLLASRVGKAVVTVSMQPLDINGTPWSTPFVRTGTLQKVNPPDSDSTGTGASMLELTVSIAGTVS